MLNQPTHIAVRNAYWPRLSWPHFEQMIDAKGAGAMVASKPMKGRSSGGGDGADDGTGDGAGDGAAVALASAGTTAATDVDVAVALVSFEDFYATHRDKLSRALSFYFGSEDLGAEAADEAFTRAYERWPTVSQHPNPYGWVYVVGTNRARSVLRRRALARSKQHLVGQDRLQDFVVDEVSDKAGDFETRAAVHSLRPALRAVVIARFYLDMSVEETATVLNVKSGTVKSRLSRALDQLRAEFGSAGIGVSGTATDSQEGTS